jgi:hypothetical protein
VNPARGLLSLFGLAFVVSCGSRREASQKPVEQPIPRVPAARHTPTDSPPERAFPANPDHEAFARARQQWPNQLGNVEIEAPLAELRAWIPVGLNVELFVRSEGFDCKPAEAQQKDGGEIALRVMMGESKQNGESVREIVDGTVGDELVLGATGSTEIQKPDGSWAARSGWGRLSGDDARAGLLSDVEKDVVRFDGERVWVRVECDGPFSSVRCPTGDLAQCDVCKTPKFSLQVGWYRSRPAKPRIRSSCDDACPPREDADVTRLGELFARLEVLWRRGPRKNALYRSLADCRAQR